MEWPPVSCTLPALSGLFARHRDCAGCINCCSCCPSTSSTWHNSTSNRVMSSGWHSCIVLGQSGTSAPTSDYHCCVFRYWCCPPLLHIWFHRVVTSLPPSPISHLTHNTQCVLILSLFTPSHPLFPPCTQPVPHGFTAGRSKQQGTTADGNNAADG